MGTIIRTIGTTANNRGTEGSGTTTLTVADNPNQTFNLSASRTVILPTTGVKAGDKYTLENKGAFDLVVQASGGAALTRANSCNNDATCQIGFVLLEAIQDTPTAASHWRVLDVLDEISTTLTFSTGFSSPVPITTTFKRRGIFVSMAFGADIVGTTTGSPLIISSGATDVPLRFRPTLGNHANGQAIGTVIGGTAGTTPGWLAVGSTGIVELFRDWSRSTSWGNAANTGSDGAANVTYQQANFG